MPQPIQGEVTVELCLRRAAPSVARGRQEAVRERVERLAATGRVADATVTYWSTRVCVPGGSGGPADRCPRIVDEILEAAAESEVTVDPYFRTSEAGHDADAAVLFLPVMCLLVREAGDLVGVYPVTDGDDRLTVADGLDRLAAGRDPATL